MKNVVIRLALGLALPLAIAATALAAENAPDKPSDPSAMCADMMKGAGPEGEKAMREFMQSDRAPLAMGKMMDMMGGGMMGGQGGMMSPPHGRPGK